MNETDRRLVRILSVPIVTFLAATVIVVFLSPVVRPDASHVDPVATEASESGPALPAPQDDARIGDWEGDPRCEDDAVGDVAFAGRDDPVPAIDFIAGAGDVTSVCMFYGDMLSIEVRMSERIPQETGERDEAQLRVALRYYAARTSANLIDVHRDGDRTVATVGTELDETCAGAAAWQDRVVRVEVDPGCIGEPTTLGLTLVLHRYDTDDFGTAEDTVPAGVDDYSGSELWPRTDEELRITREPDPSRMYPSPEAAIASVTGGSYVGDCVTQREPGPSADLVCSYYVATGITGDIHALARLDGSGIARYVEVRNDARGGRWRVIDPDVEPAHVPPPPSSCPAHDPACAEEGDV